MAKHRRMGAFLDGIKGTWEAKRFVEQIKIDWRPCAIFAEQNDVRIVEVRSATEWDINDERELGKVHLSKAEVEKAAYAPRPWKRS